MRIGISTGLGAAVADPDAGPEPDPQPQPPVLLIVAGQSNARVAGTSAAVPPARYTGGALGEVWSFVRASSGGWAESIAAGDFAAYDVAGNADPDNSGTAWGTEAEVVHRMRQAGDTRPVYVVKEAANGQNLHTQWHPASAGERFAALEAKVARARALVADGFDEELVVWNQGEADANDAAADAYAVNLAAWFDALRSRVSGTARVVVQRIRPLGYAAGNVVTDPQGWIRASAVREAQVAVPLTDGNATTVDTDFDPANFDELHPGQSWVEGMGVRTFAAWQGTYDGTYGAITDATPDALSFADQTGVPTSTATLSPSVPATGIERRAAVTIAGGEWRTLNMLDGDSVVQDWTSAAGHVDKFQRLQLRTTSSSDAETAVAVDVTVGGVAVTWTVTTAAGSVSYEPETDAFVAQAQANGGTSIAGAHKDALDAFYVAAKAST